MGDDYSNYSPEIAAMIWEYRQYDPDPYFLSNILKACARSGDCVPADLLLNATKMVLPEKERKIPDKERRDKQLRVCREIWKLRYFEGLSIEKAKPIVAKKLHISESTIKRIWENAPARLRDLPPHVKHDKETERLKKKYSR